MQGLRLKIQGSKDRRLEARNTRLKGSRLEGSRLEIQGSRLEGSRLEIQGSKARGLEGSTYRIIAEIT